MSWISNFFHLSKNNNLKVENTIFGLGETGTEFHLEDKNKSFLENANDLFGVKPEEFIYIYVGSISVKILATTKFINGKCKLLWMEEILLGPFDGKFKGESVDNIYAVLGQALQKVKDKIIGQKNIFVSLPAEGVFFKNILIPKIDNKNELLEAEIKKAIPIPFEDVLFANNLIWEKNNKETHFCVVMQSEFITKFEEIFATFQVKPYFEIEPFSFSRVIFKNDKVKCVVNVGGDHTLFVFIQNGTVVGVNMLEMGSSNININLKMKAEVSFEEAENLKLNFKTLTQKKMDSAGVIEDFMLEFSRNISKNISDTVLLFERENDLSVAEIAICGGGSIVPNLKENILAKFENNISVKRLNSQNIIIDENNLLNEDNIPRFAQCIGLILMQI